MAIFALILTFAVAVGAFECPTSYFRCGTMKKCIHQRFFCDGTNDCENAADEEPQRCRDNSGLNSLFDQKLDLLAAGINVSALYTMTKGCDVDSYPPMCRCYQRFKVSCEKSGLSRIPTNISSNVNGLDMRSNDLSEDTWDASAFKDIPNLDWLFLRENMLVKIDEDAFEDVRSLEHLNFAGVEIANIDARMFSHLSQLKHVHFYKFHYCTYANHVFDCSPKSDGISSLENLLANEVLRYYIWVVAFATIIGNLAVIFGRTCVMTTENKVHSLLIQHLCAADLLMGAYLIIIGSHDLFYRDKFYQHSHEWMTSWICSLSGVLSMLSSEASLFFLTAISVQRFLCITMPQRTIQITYRTGVVYMAVIWISATALAVFPLMLPSWPHFYGQNGACFPLLIVKPFGSGWQYQVFIFLGVNFVCFVFIIGAYIGMFWSIRRTRKAVNKDFTYQREGDMNFAKRFLFIIITNTLCWVPIMILTAIVLADVDITGEVYAWFTVLVVPVNSAIDPALYTLTTVQCRQGWKSVMTKKLRHRIFYSTKKPPRGRRPMSTRVSNVSTTLMVGPP
uniref:Relaxin receptor 1-like n=1 Tax=Saccoglossus kowalevskii TaxID=10224 RepID=A0ABM0M7A0_SACKO|nr:PREDICTED: relaxin receptor 1-like [Saccoglossus kowalevskii]